MEPDPPQRDLARGLPALAALALALAAFAIGLRHLLVNHPHEDAYILFEYARHLAAGHGVVFNPGGPPVEGATDFLWMVALAALAAAGIDVAVAAQLAGAVGAGLLGFVLVRAAAPRTPGAALLALAAAALGVLSTGAAAAGRVGFGTLPYAAVAVLLADRALASDRRSQAAVPWLALGLGLLRPDGAVLGAALALAARVGVARGDAARAWRRSALAALAAGAAYFLARRAYFGEWLPLPLRVKSNGLPDLGLGPVLADPLATLAGLRDLLKWSASRWGPLPFLLAMACILPWLPDRRRALREAGLVLLATACFLAPFLLARPTQNHAFRFEAPAALLVAWLAWRWIALIALGPASARPARAVALALLFAMWAPGVLRAVDQAGWDARAKSYMDVLPARASALLGADRRIVLTEAGRLPFWTAAEVHDAVGLNEPATARRPPDEAWLAAIDADVLFFHVADALRFEEDAPGGAALRRLGAAELESAVLPRWRALYAELPASFPPGVAPETLAALALARHAARGEHEILVARYDGHWRHVWAVRRSFPARDALIAEIEASLAPGAWRPYAALAPAP